MQKTKQAQDVFVEHKAELTPEIVQLSFEQLSSMEQAIIKVIFYSDSACSIKEIRSKIIMDTWDQFQKFIFEKILTTKEKKKMGHHATYEEPKYYLKLSRWQHENIKQIMEDQLLSDRVYNKFISMKQKDRPVYEAVELTTSLVTKELGISIPSFRTIKDTVENLIEIKLIKKREVKGRKVNAYYSIIPTVKLYLKKIFSRG